MRWRGWPPWSAASGRGGARDHAPRCVVGARRGLQREFLEWKRRLGKAVLLVTHDLREAFRLADRIAVMDRGRLRQVGTREEITGHPVDDFVREFVTEDAV